MSFTQPEISCSEDDYAATESLYRFPASPDADGYRSSLFSMRTVREADFGYAPVEFEGEQSAATNPHIFASPGVMGLDLQPGYDFGVSRWLSDFVSSKRVANGAETVGDVAYGVKSSVNAPAVDSVYSVDQNVTDEKTWSSRLFLWSSYFLFFVCGIGYQIQFAALMTSILYFENELPQVGKALFRVFVGAFNLPLFPMLLLQLQFDEWIDFKLGTKNAYRLRIFISMSVCTAILVVVPFLASSLIAVISFVVLLGIFNAIGNGAYQGLVCVYPVNTTLFWSVGQRVSTGIILLFQLLVISPQNMVVETWDILFFSLCAAVSIVGIFSFLLLSLSPLTSTLLSERDRKLANRRQVLVISGTRESSFRKLFGSLAMLRFVWPTAIAGILTLMADVGVITAFTYFKGSDDLALILLYINYFGDFIGRQATILPVKLICNQYVELIAAILRWMFIPLSVLYIRQSYFVNSWFDYGFVALYALAGGYIRTLIFVVGPQAVTSELRPSCSLLLNLCVTLGTYLGIIYSFTLGAYLLQGHLG